MEFKNFLREYFTFNRRERNGAFVLLVIILGLLLYLAFSDRLFSDGIKDFSRFNAEVSAFENQLKKLEDSASYTGKDFSFSGNSLEETAADIQETTRDRKAKRSDQNKSITLIELNSADTTALKEIRGIGSVFAKRILKFRDALGGFISKDQLLEVYGIDREKFDQVSTQVLVDTLKLKKLNINTASVDDLNLHPYITKKQAVAIFNSRVKHGDFSKVEEIKNIALLNDSAYLKVVPYLTVQ